MQSRYYDSNIGRFINADEAKTLLDEGVNLFSYCNNNCVIGIDKTGRSPAFVVAVIICGIVYYKKYVNSFNCYAYAMGEYGKWMHPGKGKINVLNNGILISNKYAMPGKYSVDNMIDWVIKDFGKKVVRKVKNKNSKLKKGEYLVAVRIQKIIINGKCRHIGNFHFMKQDPQTKKWWEKPGKLAIHCLGKINPDNYKYWGNCNSKTGYLAVKKKFTSY